MSYTREGKYYEEGEEMSNVHVLPNDEDFQEKAKRLVRQYLEQHFDGEDAVTCTISVVWFCKTLQNWKALLCTTMRDRMYYEVTYNGDNCEAYLDAYTKVENVRISDHPSDFRIEGL
jgi:hypothetical protein